MSDEFDDPMLREPPAGDFGLKRDAPGVLTIGPTCAGIVATRPALCGTRRPATNPISTGGGAEWERSGRLRR